MSGFARITDSSQTSSHVRLPETGSPAKTVTKEKKLVDFKKAALVAVGR